MATFPRMAQSIPLWIRRQYILLSIGATCILWLLLQYPSQLPARDPGFGLLSQTSSKSPVAIATFLTGTYGSGDDNYYTAARILTYQLLHANETRCSREIPFLILVTNSVSRAKQQQLARDGATIVQVEDVPLHWWIKTGVKRWKDQFTKLRLFQMVQYERILFLDADTLLTRPVDPIFDEPAVRTPEKTRLERSGEMKADESPLPAEYIFAARSDNALSGEREHPFPPAHTEVFSAGFWVAAPSHELYAYLLSVMGRYRRFDPYTMEQSLLNYAFRRAGTMPWTELDYKWSATWPNLEDKAGGVAALHEKFWGFTSGDMRNFWEESKENMENYYKHVAQSSNP
ncbi:MAG: hypothetical protein M1824_004654 [Vezdaea acicularis]|nr:MAG: hypothetical protein M1824_004654 [Vezdaea acicularis]